MRGAVRTFSGTRFEKKRVIFTILVAVLLELGMMRPLSAEAGETGGLERGALIEVTPVAHYSVAEIDTAVGEEMPLIGSAKCDVRVVSLKYATIGVAGEPADATAALLLPDGGPSCADHPPLLGWARGTETKRDASQVDMAADVANFSLSAFFAAKGYAVVATDYLGLGGSSYPFHPYLHAASEASAIVDALRAARLAARDLEAELSDAVLLAGYSQGGHAAFAAQQRIESAHAEEFDLVATVPMSGPYDLSANFVDQWGGAEGRAGNPLGPILFSYTLVSYQQVYGDLYASPDEVFSPAFVDAANEWFPGPMSVFEILETPLFSGGVTTDDIRQPAFLEAFRVDSRHPFRQALRRNDLVDWTPKTPTVFCGSSRDSIVPFERTLQAVDDFVQRGAPVKVIDVDSQIPPDVDGLEAHAGWAAYLCYGVARSKVFDPLFRDLDG